MGGRQDYIAGCTGGTVLSIIPQLTGARVVETVVLAAVGAVVSFAVSKGLRWVFRK